MSNILHIIIDAERNERTRKLVLLDNEDYIKGFSLSSLSLKRKRVFICLGFLSLSLMIEVLQCHKML